jgi:hypothetical protein
MLSYKPSTPREQKIINNINNINKPDYNKITATDIILMLVSSIAFSFLIVFLV